MMESLLPVLLPMPMLAPPLSLSSADRTVPLDVALLLGADVVAWAASAASAAARPLRFSLAALSLARTRAASASRSEAASLAAMVAMVSGLCGTPFALTPRGMGSRLETGGITTLEGVAAAFLPARGVGAGACAEPVDRVAL